MTSNGYQATAMAHILTSFFFPQQTADMNHACSKDFYFDRTVCFICHNQYIKMLIFSCVFNV